MDVVKFKGDKFKKARGGYSRLLDITCEKCEKHICFYQKDGPGFLKRMYIDRMLDFNDSGNEQLLCPDCNYVLGIRIIYQKEVRPAYRLFVGAVLKKIVKSH